MSYNFDGKVVNQCPKWTYVSETPQHICEKCKIVVNKPENWVLSKFNGEKTYNAYSFIGKEEYIYETKSGTAVVYCSEYCRNKHNHRFGK